MVQNRGEQEEEKWKGIGKEKKGEEDRKEGMKRKTCEEESKREI